MLGGGSNSPVGSDILLARGCGVSYLFLVREQLFETARKRILGRIGLSRLSPAICPNEMTVLLNCRCSSCAFCIDTEHQSWGRERGRKDAERRFVVKCRATRTRRGV